jgi:kinesin family member C1
MFQDAIYQFSQAILLKPDSDTHAARCYNARGVVYFYLGEFKKVVKDCTKALNLDPNNANYYNCRGNAYFSLGLFAKAAADFSKAIELTPECGHGRYFNNRGSAYRRLKQFREAIDDYTAAIRIDSKNGNYYNNRGNTYFDMGELQKAIDDFEAALTLEPSSPKTKLTLTQAREALAQEARMKNSTKYTGTYRSLKVKKQGELKEKLREATIYVSPAGVEVTFVRGWRKKKEQQSFAWSEDMRIELVDDATVKLFLDESRNSWIVFVACDGPAVEEELIGRITSKYASYSTACLVAQHAAVCNEYMDIVREINKVDDAIDALKFTADQAQAQLDQYVADQDFPKAELAKKNLAILEKKIKENEAIVAKELSRAEAVRTKAAFEAGPVLDMVLIMFERVKELHVTRVNNPRSYNVDDLELGDQLKKMQNLVDDARALRQLVESPVDTMRNKVAKVHDRATAAAAREEAGGADLNEDDFDDMPEDEPESAEEEADDAEHTEIMRAATMLSADIRKAESDPVAQAAVASDSKLTLADLEDDDDMSDWDIDEEALPEEFRPKDSEIFMSIENANGMVTITPSKSADLSGGSTSELVLLNRGSVAEMQHQSQVSTEEMEKLRAEREAALSQLAEKDAALGKLTKTTQQLSEIQDELDRLKAEAQKNREMRETTEAELTAQSQMSAAEKDQMQKELEERQRLAKEMADKVAMLEAAQATKNQDLKSQKDDYQRLKVEAEQYKEQFAQLQKEKEEREKEARRLAEEMKKRESELVAMQDNMAQQSAAADEEKNKLSVALRSTETDMAQLRAHLAKVANDLAAANAANLEKERAVEEAKQEAVRAADSAKAAVEAERERVKALEAQARQEELKRRELHNLIQEIKGNIRVYIRLRPNQDSKDTHEAFDVLPGSDQRELQVTGLKTASATGGAARSKKWNFEFDRVFQNESQGAVFKEISQLVQSALDGYKVSVFAYGQTGSGKTYTMTGPDNPSVDDRGMIPRAVEQIFQHKKLMEERGWSYTFEARFLEIYNKHVRDLLDENDSSSHEIKMIKDKDGKNVTIVTNLNKVVVNSAEELLPLLDAANSHRSTGSTESNLRSSRSHSVFQLRISGVHAEQKVTSDGILNLIDLAGSERVDRSKVTGTRLEETKNINASLTCLGDVIAALAQNAKHVPFRNSKLTHLLQDSFEKGSKTLMFINIGPESSNISESVCSLRFGSKVWDCHIGSAKKNQKRTKAKR